MSANEIASSIPARPLPGQRLPGDFVGPELANSPETFIHELSSDVRTELARLLDAMERGVEDAGVERAVHAALQEASERTWVALTGGVGAILVRGVPVHGRSREVLGKLYTLWGRALGTPEPQNLDGDLLTDVRDAGEDPTDPDVRLYRTRAEQDFHTDGADIIGLLCLRGAKSGGESRLVSSVRVYQVVSERHPELAPLLYEPWFFGIPGARARGLPEALPRPIVSFDGTKLETFYIGWYIRNAQALGSVPKHTEAQRELLAAYEGTANDPALYLDMQFQPGDVQWIRNAFVLHKRTAYEDHPEPERKRHLLRLWLAARGIDDSMPRFSNDGKVRT